MPTSARSVGRPLARTALPSLLLLAVLAPPAARGAGPEIHFDLKVTVVGDGRVQGDAPTANSGFIDCPDTCAASIDTGATITLTATPRAGWTFDGWSGDCIGTGPCSVKMDQVRSVRATFAPAGGAVPQFLSLSVRGPGIVSSNPAGIACPPTCSANFPFGSEVVLTPTPDAGATFVGFEIDCFGQGPCRLVMDRPRTVLAEFALPGFRLDVSVVGSGTVTSAPEGIACPTDCDQSFPTGTAVSLTPTAAPGWAFAGWEGACTGAGPCVVSIDRARSVVARFVRGDFPLTVTVIGPGTVTSSPAGIACPGDCQETYPGGTVVTLTATANAGAGGAFAGWEGACAGTGPCTLTMSAARAVTARFTTQSFPLTVAVSGSGVVTSSPAGISCPPACTASFAAGSTVTLTPAPAPGFALTAWSGSCAGAGGCSVRMDGARSVGAAFGPRTVTSAVTVRGGGTVASSPAGIACPPDCEESFTAGTAVTLTATPAADWTFAGWQGGCAGTGPCALTPLDDVAVTARFSTANPNVDRTSPGSARRVDGYDVALMLQAVSAGDARYDLNGDGRTDLNDLNIVLQAMGQTP